MRRAVTLVILSGCLIGMAVGCDKSSELAALKEKNAELERAIAARDKEIADLKARLDGKSEDGTKVAPPPPAGKVFRTGAELFADMPRDAYPKFGPAAGVERAATKKWANDNLKGRVVEWPVTVTKAAVTGDGPFSVRLSTAEGFGLFNVWNLGTGDHQLFPFGPEIELGGEKCSVLVDLGLYGPAIMTITYPECTTDEAKRLRASEGKKVTLRAAVTEVHVFGQAYSEYRASEKEPNKTKPYKRVLLVVSVSRPSVDGFLPEADKPKEPKDKK